MSIKNPFEGMDIEKNIRKIGKNEKKPNQIMEELNSPTITDSPKTTIAVLEELIAELKENKSDTEYIVIRQININNLPLEQRGKIKNSDKALSLITNAAPPFIMAAITGLAQKGLGIDMEKLFKIQK